MERGRPGLEPGDETTTASAKPGAEFLATYLKKIRSPETDSAIESDEDEPGTPTKRWRRFFSRVFKGTTVVEPIGNTEPRPTRLSDSFPLFKFDSITPVDATQAETEATVRTPVPAETEQDREVPASTDNTTLYRHYETPIIPDSLHTFTQSEQHIERPEPILKSVEHKIEQVEVTASQAERRAAATTALVGLEYIGRRRADRKIKREVTKIDQRIEQQQQNQEKLEQLQAKTLDQLAQLKQRRTMLESTSVTARTERVQVPNTEVQLPRTSERRQPRIEAEPVVRHREVEAVPRPEIIMQQVAKAAEVDSPIEQAFERSHEVKDDATFTAGHGLAGAGGLSSGSAQSGLSHVQDEKLRQSADTSQSTQRIKPYKKAAISGFITGVVIIAILVAALILG